MMVHANCDASKNTCMDSLICRTPESTICTSYHAEHFFPTRLYCCYNLHCHISCEHCPFLHSSLSFAHSFTFIIHRDLCILPESARTNICMILLHKQCRTPNHYVSVEEYQICTINGSHVGSVPKVGMMLTVIRCVP